MDQGFHQRFHRLNRSLGRSGIWNTWSWEDQWSRKWGLISFSGGKIVDWGGPGLRFLPESNCYLKNGIPQSSRTRIESALRLMSENIPKITNQGDLLTQALSYVENYSQWYHRDLLGKLHAIYQVQKWKIQRIMWESCVIWIYDLTQNSFDWNGDHKFRNLIDTDGCFCMEVWNLKVETKEIQEAGSLRL